MTVRCSRAEKCGKKSCPHSKEHLYKSIPLCVKGPCGYCLSDEYDYVACVKVKKAKDDTLLAELNKPEATP